MDHAITRIKACLNGRRGRDEHPAVPVTPGEVARAAAAAAAAGAEAVHLHARGAGGDESLLSGDVGAAVAAVRQACPGLPVGVSTGLWITAGDHPARQAAVARWAGLPATARPDFASVNVSEEGWAEVARALAGAGIGVEAGVWSVADVRAAAAEAAPGSLLRVMVEVMGATPGQEAAAAGEILAALGDSALRGVPRLLHGEGAGCGRSSGTRERWGWPPGSGLRTPWWDPTAARSAATRTWSGSPWPRWTPSRRPAAADRGPP